MDTTRTDVLISRALDRAAAPTEWDELEELLARAPATGLDLARALRADAALERGLADALGGGAQPAALAALRELDARAPRSPARLRPLSGWIAASLLACGWVLSAFASRGADRAQPAAGAPVDLAQAGAQDAPAASALPDVRPVSTAPLGEPLGELPLMMVESRPLDGGGYEVLYLRSVLERARVDGLLELAADEGGAPRVVPAGGAPALAGGEIL